jgi:hypothetical protein
MALMERRPTMQPIGWVRDMTRAKLLDLSPPYQRRSVWNKSYQQYFIDSIYKNYPVPPLFVNLEVTKDGTTVYHVIDGKQRLTAILEFLEDEFSASKSDDSPKAIRGKYFSEWSSADQRAFFSYFLPFEFFSESSDEAVIEIFNRFNRNVQRLNDQELRNARFSGQYAILMEKLTDDEFWSDLNFFGTADIRRMKDVEYVATIFSLTMRGLTEGDDLDSDYAQFDEELPDQDKYIARYKKVQKLVGKLGDLVTETRFRNRGDFYSLWSALLEKVNSTKVNWPATVKALKAFAAAVDKVPKAQPGPKTTDAERYSFAARSGTNKLANRETRKEILLSKFV